MPFTTMNNYNWLFDESGLETNIQMPIGADPVQSQTYQPPSSSSFYAPNASDHFSGNQPNAPLMQNMMPSNTYGVPAQTGSFPDQSSMIRMRMVPNRPSQMSSSSAMGASTTASYYEHSSPGNFSNHRSPASDSQSSVSEHEPPVRQENVFQRSELVSTMDPLQTFGPKSRKMLPIIDQVTRNRILDFIIQAGPKTPEGTPISRGNSLLSLPAMQNYYDLFFCRFNITYPLLHQPTFEPSRAENLLMVSILLLGATYGEKAGHRLAVCIHDVLRAQIFQNAAFQAQPDLWILQTILLVECFGKSRAGQMQHDMAHLFHGLLIK